MDFQLFLSRFYRMEEDEHLFDYLDRYGVSVWDIVRHDVFYSCLWTYNHLEDSPAPNSSKQLLEKIHSFLSLGIYLLFKRPRCLFFLCSRNTLDKSTLKYDANADNTLSLFNKKDLVLLESFSNRKSTIYFNNGYPIFSITNIGQRIIGLIKKYHYDYSPIIKIVEKYFPDNVINCSHLDDEYGRFNYDRRFYKLLLKLSKTSCVFLTQNNLQKGLLYAAHSLGIHTVEFQHGVVYDGHPAYSYPHVDDLGKKVITSDYIFSFSPFWLSSFYLPKTTVIPVGNDYFSRRIEVTHNSASKQRIIVVSANEVGFIIRDFVKECLEYNNTFSDYTFVFKLHPNQFNQFEYYKGFFSPYDNVEVISNQKSIPDLLYDCETMISIDSTAEYEALQSGRKVVKFKRASYNGVMGLFQLPNVYIADNPHDLYNALTEPIINEKSIFFDTYNKQLAIEQLKAINVI